MLDYVSGPLARVSPTEAVVDAAGVGYLLNITLTTYSELSNRKEAKLLVHEIIREDAHDLFGFLQEEERALFRLLIGVSGVGPNTARVILSSFTPAQLQTAISTGDAERLKAVKGIGLKTAQRIIVDLKGRLSALELAAGADGGAAAPAQTPSAEAKAETVAALVMLGYQKAAAQKTVDKIFAAEPTASVEAALKRALSMI